MSDEIEPAVITEGRAAWSATYVSFMIAKILGTDTLGFNLHGAKLAKRWRAFDEVMFAHFADHRIYEEDRDTFRAFIADRTPEEREFMLAMASMITDAHP